MPDHASTPIACTLQSADYATRLAWIAALMGDALVECTRRDLTLGLRFAPEARDRVRELVARERACCGFLTFDLRAEPDAIRLMITVPEAAREAADALLEQFVPSGRPGARPTPATR